jgi:hypothetical protein
MKTKLFYFLFSVFFSFNVQSQSVDVKTTSYTPKSDEKPLFYIWKWSTENGGTVFSQTPPNLSDGALEVKKQAVYSSPSINQQPSTIKNESQLPATLPKESIDNHKQNLGSLRLPSIVNLNTLTSEIANPTCYQPTNLLKKGKKKKIKAL